VLSQTEVKRRHAYQHLEPLLIPISTYLEFLDQVHQCRVSPAIKRPSRQYEPERCNYRYTEDLKDSNDPAHLVAPPLPFEA
jgi:hypothetical protein